MRIGCKQLQKHWELYVPRDLWKYASHVLLQKLSKRIPHTNPPDMEKSTYNDKVYSDLSFVYGPNKKFACKYVWHLMVDSATGYVTDRFYKAKGSFSKPACEHRQEWKNLETRLKSFNEKTLEKTNFLHQEQESLIGNLAQNLNIQLKQPPTQ